MSSTETTQTFHLELTSFLKIYYDFVYFLCLCPFRLVYIRVGQSSSTSSLGIKPGSSPKSSFCSTSENIECGGNYYGSFIAKTWLPQKLVCGFLTILGLTWQLRDLRLSVLNDTGRENFSMKNPSIYFKFMLGVVGVTMKLAVVRVFWFKSEEMARILNFMVENSKYSRSSVPEQNRRSKRLNLGIFMVILLYTLISVLNWVLGRGLTIACYEGPLITNWSGKWWWSAVVNASKYNLFMSSDPGNKCSMGNGTLSLMGGLDTAFGVIGALGFYYRRILGSHCNCFLLMAILTLWTSIKSFTSGLPNQHLTRENNDIMKSQIVNVQIYQGYLATKQLAKMINSVYGLSVTLFLVEAILYYAISFDDIFVEHGNNNDVTKVIRLLFYFGSTCAVLIAAADVSKQMNYFKEWLSVEENRKGLSLSSDCLYMVTNELDNHVVAIRGSGVFTVTYSLAAKLLGVTLTYFIICVQV